MPGDPVLRMLTRTAVSNPETVGEMRQYYENVFGLDLPLWQQYLNHWVELSKRNLGLSVWLFPPPVTDVILMAVPYTLALLTPAILLSWYAGNKVGAMA